MPRLSAGFNALVVEMHIEKVKFLFGFHILKLRPGADAVAAFGIPAQAGFVGRFTQPEIARFQ
jgi:hypothetical protein